MTFNPNLPTDDTFITSVASILRSNFTAMSQGDTSFSPLVWNCSSIENNPDPQSTSTISRTFLKKDSYGNLNLFISLPNSQSGAFSQTLMPPCSSSVPITSGSLTLNYSFLPGGWLIGFGTAMSVTNNAIFPFTAFSLVSSLTATPITQQYDANKNFPAVTMTPVSSYVINGGNYNADPKNTYKITLSNSKGVAYVSIIVIGVPSQKFLSEAFSNKGS